MSGKDPGAGPALFCFGLGYTAGFPARRWAAEGGRSAGTSRDPASCARLGAEGFDMQLFAPGRPLAAPEATLRGATHLFTSVPPGAAGDPVLGVHGADIAALTQLEWVGYLSTTGVYGDRGGAWVDESSALTPSGERGRRRVAAEAQWLDLHPRHPPPVHVFRLPGIYGPGRRALENVREGRARRVDKPGQVFSRIHVADIVATLRASMGRPDPGAAYKVRDREPAP